MHEPDAMNEAADRFADAGVLFTQAARDLRERRIAPHVRWKIAAERAAAAAAAMQMGVRIMSEWADK